MNETDKAWMAGIVDGEGCISVRLYNKKGWDTYTSEIVIANSNYEMIHKIQMLWGGKINIVRPKNKKWKDSYRWTISDRQSITDFLHTIFPYLVTKNQQALMVLTLLERRANRVGVLPYREHRHGRRISDLELKIRKQIYMECRRLNQRGKKK